MHPKLSVVEGIIHETLKPLGFKKQKLVWRRRGRSLTQIVGLEKSSYGCPTYYLSYGLFVGTTSAASTAPLHDADVQWGIEEKVSSEADRKRLFAALDMEREMSDADRASAIREMVNDYVLPAFDATDTIDKLRCVLRDCANPFHTYLVGFDLEML